MAGTCQQNGWAKHDQNDTIDTAYWKIEKEKTYKDAVDDGAKKKSV